MKLLVLDSSLESLIAWSAAEFYTDETFTLLLSSESRNIEWSTVFPPEVICADKCVKDIPISCALLESNDQETVKLFRLALETNAIKDSNIIAEEVISSLLTVIKEVTVRPLLLDLSCAEGLTLPIFGFYTVLKHYAYNRKSSVGADNVTNVTSLSTCDFDWLSWCSTFSTLCNKLDKTSLNIQLESLEKNLSTSEFSLDSSVHIGWVAIMLSLIWHTRRLEFMGFSLGRFPHVKRHMSSVIKAAEKSDGHKCFVKYHKLHDEAFDALEQKETNNVLSNVVRELIGKKFYATTALAYTNGPPHIGHTYEVVTADILVRYMSVLGMNTTFLTGTDEHGLKVATTAENSGVYPIELADFYSAKFRENNVKLQTSPDLFVRTSDQRHYKSAEKVWRQLYSRGDIYLGEYSGWYNVREETFLTEIEAASTDYKDPVSGKPYTLMKEPSYFFRMGKYQQRIIDKISNDPTFVQPESARNEMLSRLKKPLEDLSVSRCNFKWGIPVPDDPSHVMYVWCDALTGYLSGIGFGDHDDVGSMKLWPPDIQIIGKDILWFHAVVWISILMSLDVELPKTIFAHGFITASDGRKMSKSLGNVIHTDPLLQDFGVDSLRYYMIRDSVFGSDVKFDLVSMTDIHNADLTDNIGNLVHRITTLCVKFCNGAIPPLADKSSPRPFDIVEVTKKAVKHALNFSLQDTLNTVIEAFRDTNKYITDREPWAKHAVDTRSDTIRNTLEAVYFLTHLLQPVIPLAASAVFKKLHTPPKRHIGMLSHEYDNLVEGTPVHVGSILFQKMGDKAKA